MVYSDAALDGSHQVAGLVRESSDTSGLVLERRLDILVDCCGVAEVEDGDASVGQANHCQREPACSSCFWD